MEINNNILKFGHGGFIVEVGEYGDKPAVFIAPCNPPGVVGELAPPTEGDDRYKLQDGEYVMTFPTKEQAFTVANALTKRVLLEL